MAGSPKALVEQSDRYVYRLVKTCIRNNMSKDETARNLQNIYRIPRETTNLAWGNLELVNPEYFRSYYARLHQRYAPTSPPEVDSAMARRGPIPSGFGEQQQRLLTRPRLMGTAQNFQRHAAASSSSQVPQEAANAIAGNPLIFVEQISSKVGPSKALENQNLQASHQPVYGTADFRQQLMIMLAKIERNTDQMVKLMTMKVRLRLRGIHGCPHRSAAGSLKVQRVEQTKESGDNEEAENLQEKERGDNEAAEKQSSCREGPLKRQRVEQTKESGDNEEAENLQEKERGDNEEAEKLQDQNLQLPQ